MNDFAKMILLYFGLEKLNEREVNLKLGALRETIANLCNYNSGAPTSALSNRRRTNCLYR